MEIRAEAHPQAVVHIGPDRTQDPVSRLEAILTQRIREMETLLQVLPIGIGIASDPHCRQIRMNPAFVQMQSTSIGSRAKCAVDVEGPASLPFEGYSRETLAELAPMRTAASQGVEVHDVELEIACEDGAIRHVLGSAAPLLDEQGSLRGSVGVFMDITERKRLETTLQNSERRLRVLLENSSDAIAILNEQGSLVYASPSSQRMLGYAPGEFIGKSPLALIHPDDYDRVLALFHHLTQQSGCRMTAEYRIQHKNGSWVYIEAVGTNLLEEPAVQGIVINYRDITAQKRHEAEIEGLNARLQRSMSETHHRVKNNLQVISALIDMEIAEGGQTVSSAALKRIGQHIQALADIHDLLTQNARTYGNVSEVSMKMVLEMLLERIQAAIEGRPICHEIEDVRLPVRECTSLALLVNELISNAIKHGQGNIGLRFACAGGLARLEVSDEGPGFSLDFDAGKTASTGLELVESVGRLDLRGKVRYENRCDGGARVIVEFPLPSINSTRAA